DIAIRRQGYCALVVKELSIGGKALGPHADHRGRPASSFSRRRSASMKFRVRAVLAGAAVCAACLAPARGQGGPPHGIIVPDTSVEHPGDRGIFCHTNHLIHIGPAGGLGPGGGMAPAQMRSFYAMPSSGGSGAIAIVDAYDYPTALSDFNTFSAQFGLPQSPSGNALSSTNQVFQVVYQGGGRPRSNSGWALEAALDIEWAHAMAPNAKIYLVEAASNSFANLFAAVDVASGLP